MTKKKYIIAGVCFFIIAFVLTRFYEPKPALISITQTSGGKTPYLYEGIVKGVMAVQEITTTRDYLNGLSIRFATLGHESLNTNALVIFDSTFTLVYQQQFTSLNYVVQESTDLVTWTQVWQTSDGLANSAVAAKTLNIATGFDAVTIRNPSPPPGTLHFWRIVVGRVL